ncbi:hypothetical protein EV363DRAFT_1175500 [Boletus edulis]|uniref:DUF6699 domain-containing protein n=1 Tax=Boletus edulis BED1 TaxID=1328754 RepID=A0AAD4BY16_BOLED|nr:hypothetical protein EV363DRAFT_1175500 [Boletus edulis]KAF8443186.1 hypothetical protein L210DRAFT_3644049 [Boletus edulis BED1]
MFKKRHSATSPGSIPDTPKLSTLSLPEEPRNGPSPRPVTRADTRRPQTPAMVTSSSSRANPTGGQPAVPLKSILKGGRNAQSHDSYDSEGEILTAKKAARSLYNIPNVPPPGSRLVPMKQPAYDLHWQLLPYDPQRSRRLVRFDMAFPVDHIVFQDREHRTKLSDVELDKPAANDTMTKMLITFEHGPFTWEVDVKNAHRIRCRDVFEAIYKAFNEQLTLEEQRLVGDRRTVEAAFRLRCKLAPGLPEVERSLGWKRVDVLLHQTIFRGLTQPKSGGDWVLHLGSLPRVPGLS